MHETELPPIPTNEEGSKRKLLSKSFKFIIILIVLLIIRSSVFEPFRIPSGSMIPTLKIGDFILVNKFSYGFKVPFSDLLIFGKGTEPIYLFGEKNPKRGDVIVFRYPSNPSVYYIKRVVGLPGDVIEIKNKVLYINGINHRVEKLNSEIFQNSMDDKYKDYSLSFFKLKFDENEFVIQTDDDNYYRTDYDKKIVPKDSFFVLGDNRDFSHDSRYWGVVPRDNIKGKAFLVWLSLKIPENGEGIKFRPLRTGHIIK